jgi:hypothetical protein
MAARRDARLVLAARNEEALRTLVTEIRDSGDHGAHCPRRRGSPVPRAPGCRERRPVCWSPEGEWRDAAPAERYSAKAMGEALGH